ncbi:MAG TPA: sugar ABC transporter permease [Armatimonadota bacterium]|nr:sugar ABC transporter permease [Armatimonadota bacterium]
MFKRKTQARQRALFILLFLLPASTLYGVFVLLPLGQALVFSLYRWRGVSEHRVFVGTENFRRLFGDPVFWDALGHNLILLIFAGGVIIILALAIAHAMRSRGKLLRSVYLFPQVMSLVVVAILWTFIYNPTFGLLNGALRELHIGAHTIAWLGNSSTALAAVAIAYIWQALGFYTMLLSAGIQTIPGEVLEAARLDGAEGLTLLRRITLPMLWAVLRVAIIYLAISTLNIFALVFLMTAGGPDRHTEVMLTYLYEQAFTNSDFGYATALAIANLVIVMAISGVILGVFGRNPQESRK